MGNKIGGIAFIIGFVLAILVAIFSAASVPEWAVWTIAIVGLISGLFNVADEEVVPFLVASIAFLVSFQALSGVLTNLAFGWEAVATFFDLVSIFVAVSAAVVAVIAIFLASKD